MDTDRQNNYTGYLGYLSSCGATYRKIGLAAKYVLIFLEEADELSRRGYRRYKQAHASELSTMPGATDAILDFLSFIGVGYSRAKRKVKSLEKKEDICARNEKKVNEFIEWLDTESDASERTRETYRFAIRSFFSYADEFNQENVKRFLKTLEEQKMKPATINNRMCALVKYSKFAKKPISVKRVKTQRKLSTDNIPTEKEYQALLAYLEQKPNRDPYYWLRILATTGLRLHEFMKLSWEDVANGEVVLKGKGSKFRQVFFQKSLQQEVREYMKETGRTGHLCMGKYGPMTDKGFSERLKSWGDHLGIARSKMHAHAFRHFFAKQYLKKNKDVTQLAELLGHSSLDTTMIYLQKSHDEQKETLIEMLRGNIANVHATCDSFKDVSIYDDTGHVDLSFLEVILELLNEVESAELCLTRKLSYLLAPDFADETEGKSSGKQDGKKLSAEEVLKQCTFKDNILYLPNVQLSKKTYADVKVWIEEAGGKWTGGKVQGFSFDFDATRVAGILMEGKRCNLAKDFQFFATPPEVADWLVSLAGEFSPDCKVLEPSAGTGAIIDAIHRVQPDVVVDCYELMPENKEKLSRLDHIRLLGDDFTQAEHPSEYDLIVANPPFSKNQDIRHVMQMYHDLKPGGTVAAITSRHWQQASEKVCKDFRAFLEEASAQVYEIEEGAFKKSGTGVGTIAIVINKK